MVLQAHGTASHAKTANIQRIKDLQHTVEEAEAELETCVDTLSLLTLRAEKNEQLVAIMQVQALPDHPALQHKFFLHCGVISKSVVTHTIMFLLQTEMVGMQQEQEKLKGERPLPVDHLQSLGESLAQRSAATEHQMRQLSDTQQVSCLFSNPECPCFCQYIGMLFCNTASDHHHHIIFSPSLPNSNAFNTTDGHPESESLLHIHNAPILHLCCLVRSKNC